MIDFEMQKNGHNRSEGNRYNKIGQYDKGQVQYFSNFPLSHEIISQRLPFINKLKQVRQLLVRLKNDKLRKSNYIIQNQQKNYILLKNQNKHIKSKLSVMDLISEEEEGNIKNNLNKIQNNQIILINNKFNNNKYQYQQNNKYQQNKLDKFQNEQQQHNNNNNKFIQNEDDTQIIQQLKNNNNKFIQNDDDTQIIQQLKNKQYNKIIKQQEQVSEPLISQKRIQQTKKPLSNKDIIIKASKVSKKNQLASQLNSIGHELQQTYLQVQQMQCIFSNLSQYYLCKKHYNDKNIRLKTQIQNTIQISNNYKQKIISNQREILKISQQKSQFINVYKSYIQQYVQSIIQYNHDTQNTIQYLQSLINSHSQNTYNPHNNHYQINNHHEQTTYKTYDPHNTHNKTQPNQQNILKSSSNYYQQQKYQNQRPNININLKFSLLRDQLQRLKSQKKIQSNSIQQNKNKIKNNQQNFSFHKFYTSQLYTL